MSGGPLRALEGRDSRCSATPLVDAAGFLAGMGYAAESPAPGGLVLQLQGAIRLNGRISLSLQDMAKVVNLFAGARVQPDGSMLVTDPMYP